MSSEVYHICDSLKEYKRKAAQRRNRERASSLCSRQKPVPISCILKIYEKDGEIKLEKSIKQAAPCNDCAFISTDEVRSVNHQHLYKLINALSSLNFNIYFIEAASKINTRIKTHDENIVYIDLDYLKNLKFNDDSKCLINNVQETLCFPIATQLTNSSLSKEQLNQSSKRAFNENIISALQNSIDITLFWHKKITGLQIPISENFESVINRSINKAFSWIKAIDAEAINLEDFRKSFSSHKNTYTNNF